MILQGDCREVLGTLDAASIDACITDPPYEIGFMGRKWDASGVAYDSATWEAVLRVLKPGAYLLAFGGTRTHHRMVCAIEDAGFEIRDEIQWNYGSGFPKSLNVNKALQGVICECAFDLAVPGVRVRVPDMAPAGEAHEEPYLLAPVQRETARRGVGSARAQGAGGVDARECGVVQAEDERREQPRLEGRRDTEAPEGELQRGPVRSGAGVGDADGASGRLRDGAPAGNGASVRSATIADRGGSPSGPRPLSERAGESGAMAVERSAQGGGTWPVCARCGKPILPNGLGTALKPSAEPICVARKPLVGTVAANVLEHGTGALNIDGCRIEVQDDSYARNCSGDRGHAGTRAKEQRGATDYRTGGAAANQLGRWPANVILDPEAAAVLNEQSGKLTGGASRFFYVAKPSKKERGEFNTHPTVKPLALLRYLIRLVTPPGGTVIDPFAGSGSLLLAAQEEGFSAIGIELVAEHIAIAERRMAQRNLFAQEARIT